MRFVMLTARIGLVEMLDLNHRILRSPFVADKERAGPKPHTRELQL